MKKIIVIIYILFIPRFIYAYIEHKADYYECAYCNRTVSMRDATTTGERDETLLGVEISHYHYKKCPFCGSISEVNVETGNNTVQEKRNAERFMRETGLDKTVSDWTDKQVKDIFGTKENPGAACFIATAAYGTPMADDVVILKNFRDDYLITNKYGSIFVDIYYKNSPPIAKWISESEYKKTITRLLLTPIIYFAKSCGIKNPNNTEKR